MRHDVLKEKEKEEQEEEVEEEEEENKTGGETTKQQSTWEPRFGTHSTVNEPWRAVNWAGHALSVTMFYSLCLIPKSYSKFFRFTSSTIPTTLAETARSLSLL